MLSRRLQSIFNMVDSCDQLCDVGSDHALLPIALLNQEKIKKAVIVEIAEKPLQKARLECVKQGLLANVEFFLSDGLKQVPVHVKNVVCAGMGFDTIAHIINQSMDIFQECDQIILQSNTKIEELRKFMSQKNFTCIKEEFIYDRKRFYFILKYRFNPKHQQLSEKECFLGPLLSANPSDVYLTYCLKLFHQYSSYAKKNPQRYLIKVKILKDYLESKGML